VVANVAGHLGPKPSREAGRSEVQAS
jgi:hypothetical protein